MDEPSIRCPGSYENGCSGELRISAEWCGECGRSFAPGELWDRWVSEFGWMEAELTER